MSEINVSDGHDDGVVRRDEFYRDEVHEADPYELCSNSGHV